MADVTAYAATDMTDWDLLDIARGTVVAHTSSAWHVEGFGGLNGYNFAGSHLKYGLGSPYLPTKGVIQDYALYEDGALSLTISGSIKAVDFSAYVLSNDATGLQEQWFKGDDDFTGSAQSDHLLGYAGADNFDLTGGGSDHAEGGKGDDVFLMEGSLEGNDRIEGGDGTDTVILNGTYFTFFTPSMMTSVENLVLAGANSYVLHLTGGNVGHGGLTVDGSILLSNKSVDIFMDSGSKGFTALGGAGKDHLVGAGGRDNFAGNDGSDFLQGGRDADTLTGGGAADVFVYDGVFDSRSSTYDTITDFDMTLDKVGLDYAIDGVDAAIGSGALWSASFDANLAAAVNSSVLEAHHAVLFTPSSGDVGQTFLVIDANGHAGYQAGKDYVICLANASNLGALGSEDFIVNS